MKYVFSDHAIEQLQRRDIKKSIIESIIENPDNIIDEKDKRIYQGIIKENDKKRLFRIFVNINVNPYVIITAYKTSKIEKYYESKV